MTDSILGNRIVPVPAALVAIVLGAFALAGCSGTHVGESWQCPLAQGGSCDSVAAADPAVPDAAARKPVRRKPLYEVRGAERPDATPARRCDAGCGGFDPFAWLARLFGGGDDGARHEDADPAPETPAPVPDTAAATSVAQTPVLPPEPDTLPVSADSAAGDLRTGEVVGRIWIAPFVDADGVYREAFHVRAVLEPAGWRLR